MGRNTRVLNTRLIKSVQDVSAMIIETDDGKDDGAERLKTVIIFLKSAMQLYGYQEVGPIVKKIHTRACLILVLPWPSGRWAA